MTKIDELRRVFAETHPRSRELFERGSRLLAGGETRSTVAFPPFPPFLVSGSGGRVADADELSYVDLANNYTSLVHGNAFPPATEAAAASLSDGTVFPSPHSSQLALAEEIIRRIDSVERVRFTNSGSEATVLAARIARHVTGRRTLIAFQGGYHGGLPPFSEPDPEVLRVPYNDLAAVEAALAANEVAAVFAEGFLGAAGVIAPAPGFLAGLQALAHEHGALFVLDELQSFRSAWGGYQSEQDVAPDLTTLGKCIGGGFAIGAIGGRAALLDEVFSKRAGSLMHAGTFNGHTPAMAAGLATLQHFDETAITALNARSAEFADAVEAAARRHDVTAVVTRVGSIMNVHFRADRPTSAYLPETMDPQTVLHLSLLIDGVFATPRGMMNLSTALTDEDLSAALDAYDRAFAAVAES